jgi:hypothetical protein
VRPPTFVVFTSGGKPGLHFSYERYLLNRLREEFDFFATPLRIVEKHKKFSRKGAKAQRHKYLQRFVLCVTLRLCVKDFFDG